MDLFTTQTTQKKKNKTYVEKVSVLIINGILRICQLAVIDPAEIIVPFTTDEIKKKVTGRQ